MKLLLIDDDPISRLALTDALGPLKHLTHAEANSGEQAWELLEAGMHPALCCCDVRMPGMSGIELLERMRLHPRLRKIPVLLVSSAADRQTVIDGIRLSAGGFIVKPFQALDLRQKIRTLLGPNLETLFELRAEAIRRLGITQTRYTLYLEAHASQLDKAEAKMRADAALDATTLDALHTGCLTLGAYHCAGVIEGLKEQLGKPFDAEALFGISDCAAMLRDRAEGKLLEWK